MRNQHAVEGQAVSTIQAQLGRMGAYADLHAQMTQEVERSKTQESRLETLLARPQTSAAAAAAAAKETVTSVAGKVAGVVHVTSPDEVIKTVLAAIGFKTYEIASYKTLIATAEMAGASDAMAC